MTSNPHLWRIHPSDLDGLRSALAIADPERRLAQIGMRRIEIAPDVVPLLPGVVDELTSGSRVVLVVDSRPALRGDGLDLKTEIAGVLGERFSLSRAVLGDDRAGLQADETAIAEAATAVAGSDCVVVVGSGTITDICKEATARTGGTPLVVVQTAGSVNAFSDNMAVLLKSGVKRTVSSRWPDALLVDLLTLAHAPPVLNQAGFGDMLAIWTAPADWYLASILGMDTTYHPAPVEMLWEPGRAVLARAGAVGESELEGLDFLARLLTLSGIALGIAGSTAPLSGTEHLVSHLIDMSAEQNGAGHALHGAQVGVASVCAAAAWEIFLAEFDPAAVDLDQCFPVEGEVEPAVREAFASIDPSGVVGESCWIDYREKLRLWHSSRSRLESLVADWPEQRARIGEMITSSAQLGEALQSAGAPARFGDLTPPVTPKTASWALLSCHLMRNRFTLVDLLFFCGWWNEEFVERVLDRARAVGSGL